MDWQELRETTLTNQNRTLVQITREDAADAEKFIQMLMGEVVESRKSYIMQYANLVKELDV